MYDNMTDHLLAVRRKLQALFLHSVNGGGFAGLTLEALADIDTVLTDILEECVPEACSACGLPVHLHIVERDCPVGFALEVEIDAPIRGKFL